MTTFTFDDGTNDHNIGTADNYSGVLPRVLPGSSDDVQVQPGLLAFHGSINVHNWQGGTLTGTGGPSTLTTTNATGMTIQDGATLNSAGQTSNIIVTGPSSIVNANTFLGGQLSATGGGVFIAAGDVNGDGVE